MSDELRHGYWRSLAELLGAAGLREDALREFPPGVDGPPTGMSRRAFMKLLGASAALAGLGACTRAPEEKILPYGRQTPELTPGIPLHYATSMVVGGYATGLLVESHEGRPTKVEGNPEHPASLGAAGVYEQASVLQLYDPYRARSAREGRTRKRWEDFARALGTMPGAQTGGTGSGLHFLLRPTSSPLTATLIRRVRERYPEAQFHFYAPFDGRTGPVSSLALLGDALVAQHDFSRARVVLALDSDFMGSGPFSLRYARDFAARRHSGISRMSGAGPGPGMNRLYAVEGMWSPTGTLADHRLRVRAGDVAAVAAALLREVITLRGGSAGAGAAHVQGALEPIASGAPAPRRWVDAVARDLVDTAGSGIVIAGYDQTEAVHAIALALNAVLGNTGRTVWYSASPIFEHGEASHDLAPLVDAMRAGEVQTLVIAGGNPAYDAPADLDFTQALKSVPHTAYVGMYENETAAACRWFAPESHYLESWGDARAYDGTVSLIQPLIAPLYDTRTVDELLAVFAGPDRAGGTSAHSMLRESWRDRAGGIFEEREWEETVGRGLAPDTQLERRTPSLRWSALAPLLESARLTGGIDIVFERDPRVYDGSFANNAWLQELPDPITKVTWDNAAVMSPATATKLNVGTGDVVTLSLRGRELSAPAFVLPGHADDAITLRLGYGRDGAEEVARGVGVNGYQLRTRGAPHVDGPVKVERVLAGGSAERHELATTQMHWRLQGRAIIRQATIEEYRRDPDFTGAQSTQQPSLYESYDYTKGDQWAMTVDLSKCTGCGACVVACQAENNVPVVGREGVLNSREMHWLRIDRYFTGQEDEPEAVMQPMLCQHCEKAPCEYVCPVNATVHSSDGLNEMVYNRCVGTRFCSNNCPYKVRRFNWFDYNREIAETVQMVKNPDVTVRERGVMEKCSFCVQRIRRAQIAAQLDGRDVKDGEVVTACQQACPTRAIIFGSYTDPDSDIVRSLLEKRSYTVLHELGTAPRVRYLARITNPNPALEGEA
ncbi:MAG TPA: TAT-variant-translocated molybdopterin oxidoreductase [Gemmatimonadaceae bacterium]|nr:TAT-variant-translocated molybdopterin oxidoreductase [Gemmatimonadaceae bacterium]